MRSEWSRITSYLTIINLCKVKIAGALDFKMAASCFLSITQEVINRIKEHTILKSTENSTKFGIINDVKVLLFNSSGNRLLISAQVIKHCNRMVSTTKKT